MSDAIIGNPWHGMLTPDALVLDDDSEKTSVDIVLADGTASTLPYVAGLHFYGYTRYVKTPGLTEPTTPPSLVAAGGKFLTDAILFGDTGRYSPFCGAGAISVFQWLHCDGSGNWCKVSLNPYFINATTFTFTVTRSKLFGVTNKEVADDAATLLSGSVSYPSISVPEVLMVDSSHNGRSAVFFVRGTWTNETDSGASPPAVIYNNFSAKAIRSAWKIDLDEDCTTVSVTNIWTAPAASYSGNTFAEHYVYQDDKYFVLESPGVWKMFGYYRHFIQLDFDSECSAERLIGAAFDKDGTLHLIKYDYSSVKLGEVVIDFVWLDMGYVYSTDAEPPAVWWAAVPHIRPDPPSDVTESRETTFTPNVSIKSNGVEMASFSSLGTSSFSSVPMTNNVFDIKLDGVSMARVSPGAIDSTTKTGEYYASFDPRGGAVITSSELVGFV